jgi:hypothetical protein
LRRDLEERPLDREPVVEVDVVGQRRARKSPQHEAGVV